MSMDTCATFHPREFAPVVDSSGCLLAEGHQGPHEFKDDRGRLWQWETDMACDCEHCRTCDGDYCTTYWRKQYRAA